MTKLTEIRARYPQYNDLSDEVLAERLHKKFYGSMPFDEFSSKIGLRESGIIPAFKGSLERLGSNIQTAAESVTSSPEEAAIAGAKRQEEIGTRFAPGANLEKVKETYEKEGLLSAAGEAVSQMPEAVAEMAPFMAPALAGAAIGAEGGAALGTMLAPGPGTVIGGTLGGLAGAFFPSLVTRYGANVEQKAATQMAEKQPVHIDRLKALGYAVPQAGIDTFANLFPVWGRTAIAKILGAAAEKTLAKTTAANAEKIAEQTLRRRIVSGVSENLAVQGVAQPLQVMLSRMQTGKPLLTEDAINEYGHAVYMAALISPIGAYGGVKERTAARGMIEQKNAALDQAFAKMVEADTAAREGTEAPTRPQSALLIQKALGVPLKEAAAIREQLIERGDLTKLPDRKYGLYLNPEKLKDREEVESQTTETQTQPTTQQALSNEELFGDIVERTPEELAAEEAARAQAAATTTPAAPPATDIIAAPPATDITTAPPATATTTVPPPVARAKKQAKPAADKITSSENPVFQVGVSVVKTLHESNSPITPENFGTALSLIVGDVPKLQVGNLLGALTKNGILSKPDENRVRTYTPPVEVEAFKPAETENAAPAGRIETPVVESTGRGVESLVPRDEAAVARTEVDIAGRVENAGKPAGVGDIAEGRVESALEVAKPEQVEATKPEQVEPPVVEPPTAPRPQTIPEGEPVPRNAQATAPDVFAPSPEQARISTEVLATTPEPERVPGRAIARIEEAREAQREKENAPQEGVSQKYDSVAESLRAGNLGEALYRLREESSGKSPLTWLADKLLNIVEVRDDRTPLIKSEVERIAREQGINKEYTPVLHAALSKEIEKAILSDVDLTKYDFTINSKGDLTEARKNFKPKVERMVPVVKGKGQFNRATGRLEFIKPEPEQKFQPVYNKVTGKVEDIPTQPLAPPAKPFTLADLPRTQSPFKKTAFGGAKVFVEGNAKGQNKAVIDRLQREGKLAEYNPKTNTFYFTEAGLTDRVILHEMVHSATVNTMKKFLSGKIEDLTETQRQGAKEIVDIYNDTKKALGERFKNAYENEYEFITNAMTNEGFQRALSNFSAPKTAREKLRSAWSSFTVAVSKMLGLDRAARAKATEEPSATRNLEPGKGLRRAQEIERVKAADTMDNALLRTIESISDIMTVPKAGVDVEPLAARRPQPIRRQRRLTAPPAAPQHTNGSTNNVFLNSKTPSATARTWGVIKKNLSSEGLEKGIFYLQNFRRGWLKQQEFLDKGRLTRRINNPNNTHELQTLAMGKQNNIDLNQVTPLVNKLQQALIKYANKVGLTMPEAAERLGVYRMALNESEKRFVKYLEYVPLDDAPILNIAGTAMSPAAYRDALIARAATRGLTTAENNRIRQQLETLASRYAKVGGKSRKDRVPATATNALDINSDHYQVIGYHPTDLRMWRRGYQREQRANSAEIQEVFDALDAIHRERINLDRQGNYWSPQVDNFQQIYNYKYYVPYKGLEKSGTDIGFDLDTMARSGTQFRQLAAKAEGRRTAIENPLYQSIQDLQLASNRAASVGITESIKNQIKDGDLAGELVDTVPFLERHEGDKTRADLLGKNVFFHPMADGTIEVYSLKDPKLIDGLNGFNTNLGLMTRILATPTHMMGRMHTFYNPQFAPFNFVRDALTNSYTIGAKFGPVASAKAVGSIAKTIVTSRGMTQAAKISALYQKGDMAGIAAMRGTFAKDAYEYLEQGGRGSFQQSFDLGVIEQKVLKTPGNWLVDKGKAAKGGADMIATTWADTFEFVSRVGAYGTVKKELIAEAKARGINTNSPDFIAALKQEAAAFTKNAFNYEQTGKYGRELGAWYMFLRPGLTSAVRAIDAIRPALEALPVFGGVEAVIKRGPKSLNITDPADPGFARSEAARVEFRKQHAKEARNATIMTAVLGALGYAAYGMSLSASDTDIHGRNKVATDDMSMWTRAWRYPKQFSGDRNEYLQTPWGFGYGAFAAMGAQFAAWNNGNQSGTDALSNLVPIMVDSFVPIPSPRYSPTKYPIEFTLNTVMPTAGKPLLEYVLNLNGLGQEIQSERSSKYGEAFSGKESISKFARDATQLMTSFAVEHDLPVPDLNPAVIDHFVNNYFDAVGKFVNAIYGLANVGTEDRPFDAKKDVPLLGGFIGKSSDIDAKEFSEARDELQEKAALLSSLRQRPNNLFETYIKNNPEEMTMINLYNSTTSNLKKWAEQRNKLESGAGEFADISGRVRLQLLKENREMQDILKYNFLQGYKALKQQQEQR